MISHLCVFGEKCLFTSFAHFTIGSSFSWFAEVLYIFWILDLNQINDLQILYHSKGLSLHFHDSVL